MTDHLGYPPFAPPETLAEHTPFEWSRSEADQYEAWLRSVLEDRVNGLLGFLGDSGVGPPEIVLSRLGERVAWVLRKPEFSEQSKEGWRLTNRGYALAADMGLLVAKLLIIEGGGSVRWTVLRSPRSAAAYNQPVLRGFGKLFLEPVRGSVAEALSIVHGKSDGDAWRRIYTHWKSRIVAPG